VTKRFKKNLYSEYTMTMQHEIKSASGRMVLRTARFYFHLSLVRHNTISHPEFLARLTKHAACSDIATQYWSLVGCMATSFSVSGQTHYLSKVTQVINTIKRNISSSSIT